MTPVWTWGGHILLPSRRRESVDHNGKQVRRLGDQEIFDQDGQYLGEVKNDNRLITNLSKKSWRGPGITPYANRVRHVPYVNFAGYVMYVGYEDFPDPSTFLRTLPNRQKVYSAVEKSNTFQSRIIETVRTFTAETERAESLIEKLSTNCAPHGDVAYIKRVNS